MQSEYISNGLTIVQPFTDRILILDILKTAIPLEVQPKISKVHEIIDAEQINVEWFHHGAYKGHRALQR